MNETNLWPLVLNSPLNKLGILDAPTAYCPDHERLESFEEERVERDIPPEAIEVRIRLGCGRTKRIVQRDKEVRP